MCEAFVGLRGKLRTVSMGASAFRSTANLVGEWSVAHGELVVLSSLLSHRARGTAG
jgi:hypothetical protein